jgi:hypothetical protein
MYLPPGNALWWMLEDAGDGCRRRGAAGLVMTLLQYARLSDEGTMAEKVVLKFDEKRGQERYPKELLDERERVAG